MLDSRVLIPPAPCKDVRPLWSVMIPTYNCGHYLRETLLSVLAQDPGPEIMQIEVIDDSSTRDNPEAIVAEVAGDRVGFYQQPQNVGHCRNFDTCLQRSQGRLIHLLHGDDSVRVGFYRKLQRTFLENPAIGAAFCRYISMDEYGNWLTISPLEQIESGVIPGWLEKIATGQRLQPPSMVVRREVYEQLGGFDSRISYYGEDWEMWVRIAAHYPVWYEVEPLAMYRIHAASLSGHTLRTGENGRDLRRAIVIIKSYLPEPKAENITNEAKKNFALACLRRAHRMFSEGSSEAAYAQLREAIKTNHSLSILIRIIFLLMRWSWQKMQLSLSAYGAK